MMLSHLVHHLVSHFVPHRKKVAEHQRAERERAAAAKEVDRLRTEVSEAKHRRAELQRVVSLTGARLFFLLPLPRGRNADLDESMPRHSGAFHPSYISSLSLLLR